MPKKYYYEDNLMHWTEQSNCKGRPTADFFDAFEQSDIDDRRDIVALCEECPVRQECYEHAKQNKEYGLWGGVWFHAGRASSPLRKNMQLGKNTKAA